MVKRSYLKITNADFWSLIGCGVTFGETKGYFHEKNSTSAITTTCAWSRSSRHS